MQYSLNRRSRPLVPLVAAGSLAFLASCAQRSELPLNTRQQEVRASLRGPANNPALARETRIIDIHTHTFNGRYLPLEGVLLGKRDVHPAAALLSDNCARMLAQALVDRTELAPAGPSLPGISRPPGARLLEPRGGPICRVLIGLLNKGEARGVWDKSIPEDAQQARAMELAREMTFAERIAVQATMAMMGMEEHTNEPAPASPSAVEARKVSGMEAAVRFIWQITQSDGQQPDFYRREYGAVPMKGEPLMVSHMMDLGPVYAQPAQGNSLLDFRKEQVRRMEALQDKPGSGLIYFVAYLPYRDYFEGGRKGDALALVKEAVERHGAWGVKFYPPSGFRGAGNAIPARPRSLNRFAGRQWDARYKALGPDGGKLLDAQVEQLFAWCEREQVPVFTHCSTGEFEPRKGYGISNSNPKYWREVLRRHPRLRLCLGHAGSGDHWFGGGPNAEWGATVIELCRTYPNVYCELTTHAELLEPNRQAYFADLLIQEFARDASFPAGRYPLRKKLMYGTDWYLPDASDRADVLRATQRVFQYPDLQIAYQDYFSGNAARYLNLKERVGAHRSPAVRTRLGPFMNP